MNDKQLEVWSIRDANEKNSRSYWKHAGRAFVNRDGSINILLDVLPIDGKLQVRERREAEDQRPNGVGGGQRSNQAPHAPSREISGQAPAS